MTDNQPDALTRAGLRMRRAAEAAQTLMMELGSVTTRLDQWRRSLDTLKEKELEALKLTLRELHANLIVLAVEAELVKHQRMQLAEDQVRILLEVAKDVTSKIVTVADDIEAVKAETSAEQMTQILYGRLIDGVTIFGSEEMRKLIMANDRQGLVKYLAVNEPGEIVSALLALPLDHSSEIVRQLQEGLE